MRTQVFRKGQVWMENDPEANTEPGGGSNSKPDQRAITKQDIRKQRQQMFRTDNSTRATQGQSNHEWSYVMCKYIISLLFVAAALLLAAPGAQAGVYIELMDTLTDIEMDYIPTNTPVAIRVMMDNDVG